MFHHEELEIHERENQGVSILELQGKLDMGAGDIALRERAESLLSRGRRQLILDLTKVSSIDTAGAGLLRVLAEKYIDAGAKLVLCGIDRSSHARVEEVAQLESIIESYPDELDAVNSFFPDRTVKHYDILDYVESHAHEDEEHKQ
jgi:anti-sigma B factor antagonist